MKLAHKLNLILFSFVNGCKLHFLLSCNVRKAAKNTAFAARPSCAVKELSWSYKVITVVVGGVNNGMNIGRRLCRWVAAGVDWRLDKKPQVPYQLSVHVVDVDCHQLCVYFLKSPLGKAAVGDTHTHTAAMAGEFPLHRAIFLRFDPNVFHFSNH